MYCCNPLQEQSNDEQNDFDAAIAAAIVAKVSCLEAELGSLKATPVTAEVSCLEADVACLKATVRELEAKARKPEGTGSQA